MTQPLSPAKQRSVTLAMTGASGAQYGLRLLQSLLAADCKVYLLISSAAEVVIRTETDLELPETLEEQEAFFTQRYNADEDQLQLLAKDDWFAPVASGSSSPSSMVICPASGVRVRTLPTTCTNSPSGSDGSRFKSTAPCASLRSRPRITARAARSPAT